MPNTTDMAYSGYVNIKLKIGNKVIDIAQHNEGTWFLKKVFAMMLVGLPITAAHTPQYLDLKFANLEAEKVEWTSLLKQPIPLTGKSYIPTKDDETINPAATFTATLSSSNLTQTIEEMKEAGNSLRFDLVTGFDSHGIERILASILTSPTKLEKITPGTQALITWTMRLLNTAEVENDQ